MVSPAAQADSAFVADPRRLLASLRAELPYLGNAEFRFRPLVEADAERLYEASRNPDFTRYIALAPARDLEHAIAQVRDLLAAQAFGDSAAFACVRHDDLERWCGILRVTPWRDGLEMGLWAHPDVWGGTGTRMARLAVAVGFTGCTTPVVYAKADHRNRGGQRVLEYCFMSRIGPAQADTESGARLVGDEWMVRREVFERSMRLAAPAVGPAARRDAG